MPHPLVPNGHAEAMTDTKGAAGNPANDHSSKLKNAWSRIGGMPAWLVKEDGKDLYDAVDGKAQRIKALLQMAIGVGTAIAVLALAWVPRGGNEGVADFALRFAGVGLALAAVVELMYTFFTDGPDEALDPLILGVSAFILIKISDPKTGLTVNNAGTVILLIVALAALFVMREQFIEKPKRNHKNGSKNDHD
jgi:hypothetical protein